MEWLSAGAGRLGAQEGARPVEGDAAEGPVHRTVLHEPELLILDEPFSGLDPINQDVLESIVREQRDKGTTILFSTHLMEQAERLCERVCLISKAARSWTGT